MSSFANKVEFEFRYRKTRMFTEEEKVLEKKGVTGFASYMGFLFKIYSGKDPNNL